MKWESKLVMRNGRQEWELGIKDTILKYLLYLVILGIVIGLYFLNSFRWGC